MFKCNALFNNFVLLTIFKLLWQLIIQMITQSKTKINDIHHLMVNAIVRKIIGGKFEKKYG